MFTLLPWHAIAVKDFFVSYNKADKAWAEWIAWVLEENGYTVVIQAWDFRPGGNFILDMQRATVEAERMVMVLPQTTSTPFTLSLNGQPSLSKTRLEQQESYCLCRYRLASLKACWLP